MSHPIAPAAFRRYDIRGTLHEEIPVQEVFLLGLAYIGYVTQLAQDTGNEFRVFALGHDSRSSGFTLKRELLAAFNHLSCVVVDLGQCPTPVFNHYLATSQVQSGIMITASHNASDYVGFKLRYNGHPLWGRHITNIMHYYRTLRHHHTYLPSPSHDKRMVESLTHTDAYLAQLKNLFPSLIRAPIHAIIDCMHTVNGPVVEQMIASFGWRNVHAIRTMPHGIPVSPPDPTNPVNIEQLIGLCKSHGVVGFALDGDGDRLAVVSEEGTPLSGDQTLLYLATHALNAKQLVVVDERSSHAVIDALKKIGHEVLVSACGSTNMQEVLHDHNAALAGELSGHFFFADRYFGFDDGLYALLRIAQALQTTNQKLSSVFTTLRHTYTTPELRIPMSNTDIDTILQAAAKHFGPSAIATEDNCKVETKTGWILIRKAHTQELLSIRVESYEWHEFASLLHDLEKLLAAVTSSDILREYFQPLAQRTESYRGPEQSTSPSLSSE